MKNLRNAKLVWSGRTVRAKCERCGCRSVGLDCSGCREVCPEAAETAIHHAIDVVGWRSRNGELMCLACVGGWELGAKGPTWTEAD